MASQACQDTAIARALDQVRDARFAAALALANTRP